MQGVDPPLMPLALRVLEEEITRAEATGRRSWAARLALAYLGTHFPANRSAFDWYWQSMTGGNEIGRQQNLNAALNMIYRECGVRRG